MAKATGKAAAAPDEKLRPCRAKRDFTKTRAPTGGRLDASKKNDPWAGHFDVRQQMTAGARRAVRGSAGPGARSAARSTLGVR